MKKTLLFILSFIVAIGTLCGCGNGNNGNSSNKSDDKKFELTVWNFDGGFGTEWLYSAGKRYEEVRKNDSIMVDGKEYIGIKVTPTPEKREIKNYITDLKEDVIFAEGVSYLSYVRDGYLADITEMVKGSNKYETDKTNYPTVLSRFYDKQNSYFEVNGKYYGVPHYAGFVGVTYNMDIFDATNAYFCKNYKNETNLEDKFIATADAAKSAGPDGKENTDDDGLPTTYQEFFWLCEYLKGSTYNGSAIAPITFSSDECEHYLNQFMDSLTANYEGFDSMNMYYSFSGTANGLHPVSDDNSVTADINSSNGYQLQRLEGKYQALSFVETMAKKSAEYVSTRTAFNNAQDYFIKGESNAQKPYSAMIREGTWWENEADETFKSTRVQRKDRRYGFMPLPCATDELAQERAENYADEDKNCYTLIDALNSVGFVNNKISNDRKVIAMDFLQFCNTSESLSEFTTITDTTKALKYTLTAQDLAKVSTFGKSIIDMQNRADVVNQYDSNDFFRLNESTFISWQGKYTSMIDGKPQKNAFDQLKKVNAQTYLDGMFKYWKEEAWIKLATGE